MFIYGFNTGVSDSKRFCQEPVYTGNLSQCDDICHIGDNQKTDIESPRRYGIQSFERLAHRNNIEPYLSKRNTLDTDILNTFVWNHLRTIADEHEKIQARIGYSVIGPLLFDFCSWLADHLHFIKGGHFFYA